MKEQIKNKLDDHVKELLAKPSISNEDYALLRERLSELPADKGSGMDWYWLMLLMMLFGGFGGGKGGV